MSEKKGIIQKLKGVKNIEIIVALILAAIVLLVFFGNFGQSTTKESSDEYNFAEYVGSVENKIESVISRIDGAGVTDIVISFSGGITQQYAYTTEKVTENGVVTEKNTLVLVSGKPVLIAEKFPEIQGVVIVAEGAGNAAVKLEIIRAVQALLEVHNENIELFKQS